MMTKEELGQVLLIEEKRRRAETINQMMTSSEFWADRSTATVITRELTQLNDIIHQFDSAQSESDIATLEKFTLFSGEYDTAPALMTIAAGSGGTEAQDWAEILMRMYLRYAEKRAMMATILDISDGEEAGIKSVLIEFSGSYAYGY